MGDPYGGDSCITIRNGRGRKAQMVIPDECRMTEEGVDLTILFDRYPALITGADLVKIEGRYSLLPLIRDGSELERFVSQWGE